MKQIIISLLLLLTVSGCGCTNMTNGRGEIDCGGNGSIAQPNYP